MVLKLEAIAPWYLAAKWSALFARNGLNLTKDLGQLSTPDHHSSQATYTSSWALLHAASWVILHTAVWQFYTHYVG